MTQTTMSNKPKNETAGQGSVELPPTEKPVKVSKFARYRLAEGQEALIKGREVLTHVDVAKPKNTTWFRTAEDIERWQVWPLFESEGRTYLIDAELAGALGSDSAIYSARLIPSITDTGKPFFWPLKIPKEGGKVLAWHSTAAAAADRARTCWVRISANMSEGAYSVFEASFDRQPNWRAESDEELLELAFGDRLIDNAEHPIIRRLLGKE